MAALITVVVAGATSLLTIAIAMATGRLFTGYGWLVPYLFVASFALYALAFLLGINHFKRERKKEASPPDLPSPVQHNEQRVTQEANPTQNIFIGKDVLPPLPPAPAPRTSEPKPNIKFIETKRSEACVSDQKFYATSNGLGEFPIMLVCFRNDPAFGQEPQQPQVKAHVIYKDADGREITDVPSGIWLEEYSEQTAFTSGVKKCLVVFLLSKQGTLKELWKEEYITTDSWMGKPVRIKEEVIAGHVATVEIRLLAAFSGKLLLSTVLQVAPYENGELPDLSISSPV